jgi:imidazolonepropionase-like amidohydrolase
MYLARRPDLLDAMAEAAQILVPTLSCLYGVAGLDDQNSDQNGDLIGTDPARSAGPSRWAPSLVQLARYNLEQADRTLRAARAAGVPIALGHDWQPFANAGIELIRMVHHGLSVPEALIAATATGARALGIDSYVGTIEEGKLADLLVLDADPLDDPAVLRDPDRVWLVVQLGEPVAGTALETRVPLGSEPARARVCSRETP